MKVYAIGKRKEMLCWRYRSKEKKETTENRKEKERKKEKKKMQIRTGDGYHRCTVREREEKDEGT